MKRVGLIFTILFIGIFLTINVQAADVPPQPEDGVWIIDSADVLSDTEFNILNDKCNEIYLQTGKPIVVLTIQNYQQQDAEGWEKWEYAKFAFDEYAINDVLNQNKAILIFMSEEDREFWTELGGGYSDLGLESYVQEVFDYDVKPYLAEDEWFYGLDSAIEGMRMILEEGEVIFPEFDSGDQNTGSLTTWIIDDAGLINDENELLLNSRINEIEINTSCPIMIITIDNLAEKNASRIGYHNYAKLAFRHYELPECGILWLFSLEQDDWEPGYYYWDNNLEIGNQYTYEWSSYLNDEVQWQVYNSLGYGSNTIRSDTITLVIDSSEKAILDDGFEIEEWLEINLYFVLLLPMSLLLGITIFSRTIPKKIQMRKRKDEALENIAIINRAIMSNLAGNSSVRKNWNGKFTDMKDNEIKSFRKLDEKLGKNDVEVSLEKYEKELKVVKEIYNLRTKKSDYFTIFMIITAVWSSWTIIFTVMEDSYDMEAELMTIGNILIPSIFFIFFGIFIFIVGGPVLSFLRYITGSGIDLKDEMGLILGLPIMSRKIDMNNLDNDSNFDDYYWRYGYMERGGLSFESSSGYTTSEERAAAASSSGGGGGGGGGGFDSGGGGGGGGGGGDF